MQYQWAPGVAHRGISADDAQAEIERIKKVSGGGATAAMVVAAARSKRSILHPLIFDVAEKEAAKRYYHHRATTVLNSIRIVNAEGEITHLRPNIRVRTGEEYAYVSITHDVARIQRENWLRQRLLSISAELEELDLWPEIREAIEGVLVAA